MELKFGYRFNLEIPEKNLEIIGTLSDITKSQQKEIKKQFKKELDGIQELQKLTLELEILNNSIEKSDNFFGKIKAWFDNRKINKRIQELVKEINDIQLIVNDLDIAELTSKYRVELSVRSDKKEELISLCEDYGYSTVFNAIVEAVNEGKLEDISN